jgi:hypothetical protein
MNQTSNAIDRLNAFLTGNRVPINEEFVQDALSRYRVRSASNRGFVIIVGDWLVLLSDETERWTAQKLPWSAGIARELGHVHSIRAIPLCDGAEVLQCVACGSEW